jgi:hypothetical protein
MIPYVATPMRGDLVHVKPVDKDGNDLPWIWCLVVEIIKEKKYSTYLEVIDPSTMSICSAHYLLPIALSSPLFENYIIREGEFRTMSRCE